jgi:pyruvate/2-oxoglutarate/acetoin dehydrogenase E1 component
MSTPKYTTYVDALTAAMKTVMSDENTIFIGQQIVYYGNPMSKTIEGLSIEKMIEVPVMEETQMGMSLGLAMNGHKVVSFYPRWDFILCASNQLINHLDKMKKMSNGQWNPHILIRVGKGSDKPLDPGHQHKGNYIEQFRSMSSEIQYYDLKTSKDIESAYTYANTNVGIHILAEYPELYYENN